MTMPTYQTLMLPVLKIHADAAEHRLPDITNTIADQLSLTSEERQKQTRSGRQSLIYNRVYWSVTYLRRAGLVESTERGIYQITARGCAVLKGDPEQIDVHLLTQFVNEAELRGMVKNTRKRGNRPFPARSKRMSRPSLFREILVEAGKPLHYAEIHTEALNRLPETAHFSKHTAYVALFSSRAFSLLGEGVFGLSDWPKNIVNDGGVILFERCPQPLLPQESSARAFFESVMVGRDILTKNPHITARQFYLRMCDWAARPGDENVGAQMAFDVWYAAGLMEHVNYSLSHDDSITSAISPDAPLADVRIYCLSTICKRISKMSWLLMALNQVKIATVPSFSSSRFQIKESCREQT